MEGVTIYAMNHLPHGRRYVWHDIGLLVIEGTLDAAGQRQAVADAFAELRDRSTRTDGAA